MSETCLLRIALVLLEARLFVEERSKGGEAQAPGDSGTPSTGTGEACGCMTYFRANDVRPGVVIEDMFIL